MITTDIIESNFNKNSTNAYELSILLGMDSFIYSISDKKHQVLVLRSYSFGSDGGDFTKLKSPLKEILEEDKLLQNAYHKVKLGILNQNATLVPTSFFDEKQKATYLDRITTLSEWDLIKVDDLDSLSTKNVYLANRDILNLIRNYFPNVKLFHSSSSLLLGFRQKVEHQTGPRLFGNVRDNNLHAVYYDGKELVFSNGFSFQSSKDFIYYVMNLYKQFNLSPEEVPFVIAGQIIEDSEIYHLLYRYIRHLKIIDKPQSIQLSESMTRQNPHFFFDLFSLHLCE